MRLDIVRFAGCAGFALALLSVTVEAADNTAAPDPARTAAQVDRILTSEFVKTGVEVAPRCNDEDFLRRASLDLASRLPSPQQVTLFGLNPDGEKRAKLVDELVASEDFARNWARYWRDVIFMNATDMRSRRGMGTFEDWLTTRLQQGGKWHEITTELLTATGDVQENGATALFFAHGSEAPEVAAEASRIFLGIQLQCANCHDHPSDVWKREQFHELAAFFPRTVLRPVLEDGRQRSFEVVSVNVDRGRFGGPFGNNPEQFLRFIDRDRDGKVTRAEVMASPRGEQLGQIFPRLLEVGDKNKDGGLDAEEIKSLPMPDMQRRGSTEHYMPDLGDPSSRGKLIQPKFFVDGEEVAEGMSDQERRMTVAKAFTDPSNPWFARAFVNRMWSELLGEGFYMPVDDMGPTRSARFPEALDALSQGFVASGYDVGWVMRTIARTDAYQRQIRPKAVSEEALPYSAQSAMRLRSDQLFSAISQVLGYSEPAESGRGGMMGPFAAQRSPRAQFNGLFGFDPSTPQDDLTGNVPQALFLMNSPQMRGAVQANGNGRLAQVLRKNSDDQDAVSELYLLVLCREPSDRELAISQAYVRDIGNRGEAFEDLMWSLLNSSEFLSKR